MTTRITKQVANVYFQKNSNISRFYTDKSNTFKVSLMSMMNSRTRQSMLSKKLRNSNPYYYKRFYSTLMLQRCQERSLRATAEQTVRMENMNVVDPLFYCLIMCLFFLSIVNVLKTKERK